MMTTPNDTCEVCGLDDFILEDGFYYCTECGTKLLNKCEIVDDEINVGIHTTIRHEAGIENKITSWEQINYFLHGLTERLIELGAPEELKTTVLQIWCAYLNHAEIAFFNKRQQKRPLLSLKNKKWDLKLLFNREIPKRNKRKAKTLEGDISKRVRDLNQDLLKVDRDAFTQSQHSDLESTISTLSTSMHSSSNSGQTPQSYKFNSRARKRLVEELHLTDDHIEWHELEAPTYAACHPFPYSAGKLRSARDADNWSYLYRKTVLIAIISIALNQVRSSIQIGDLMRWTAEGHLPFHDLRQFLPEGLPTDCYSETVSHLTTTFDGFIRCRVISSLIAADLRIVPIEPDLSVLCRRFLSELALPLDLAPYIIKVMAISPPIKRNNVYNYLPKYEAHAMKYILFVMKLLFGLDDMNETKLDATTVKLNRLIRSSSSSLPKLFVWSEWQQYVAMRSIILEQLHYPTNHLRTQSIVNRPIENDLFLHFFESRIVPDDDNTTGYKAGINQPSYKPTQERLFKNLHSFITSAMEKHQNVKSEHSDKHITFDHTLQPQRAYLAEILTMDNSERHNVYIPEYMLTDHSKRTVVPLINPMPLKMHLLKHHRMRLATKKVRPSMKHIRMAKYNSHTTNVELYLAANKFAHVLHVDDSDSSDSEDSNVNSNILDYINSRAEEGKLSPEELFHRSQCQNILEEMEADLRAEQFKMRCQGADLLWIEELTNEVNPFENNPSVDEILPEEQSCSETVQMALPNYHYWVNNGNLKDISSDVFEQEYFSLFPASFQFLLREASFVTHLSTQELYFELNELEKHYFKKYRQIK